MTTRVLTVDAARPPLASIDEAAAVLEGGGLVGFPTETFYGLGAAIGHEDAVARIFRIKGRPDSKPLLILVESAAMVETVAEVSDEARALMARYWPGALTLVLPARAAVPALVTAGTGTVGVRHSAHPLASALVRRLHAPVTAPSANHSGGPPPTTAAEVLQAFDGQIEAVIDGGRTAGGLPSTVLDLTVFPPCIRRQGAVVL
ncbi:MAG: L-threonylcarbamoyladenylate synthase [Candidatus Rokuibacteriota bacterium]